MSPLTVSVPILGALTAGVPSALFWSLGLVGLCAHLFGFGLNDLIDLPIDRRLPAREIHPLVNGSVRLRDTWLFVLVQVPVALCIYAFGVRGSSIGLLSLSIVLSILYNLWSKRGGVFVVIAEVSLAASIGLLCLSGAQTLQANLSPESIVFAFTLALILLLLNSVSSGLKDIKTDLDAGVRSFAAVSGASVQGEDQLYIPFRLKIYSAILQGSIGILTIFLMVWLRSHWLLCIFGVVLCLYSALHLRFLLSVDSYTKLRGSMPLLNGYYNYLALSLCLFPFMPFIMQLVYSLLILAVLSVPVRLGWRVYRQY